MTLVAETKKPEAQFEFKRSQSTRLVSPEKKRHPRFRCRTILAVGENQEVAKAPFPSFKNWTSNGKGLEFTLAPVVPPVPTLLYLGLYLCPDSLYDKYGVQVDPFGVFSPTQFWWLLPLEVLVDPQHLRACYENLRTSTTADLIHRFHIIY